MKALLNHADTTDLILVELDVSDHDARISSMCEHLDCTSVGMLILSSDLLMWMDDDGAFTKPVNWTAVAAANGYGYDGADYHGHALFTGGLDSDGFPLPISDEDVLDLERRLRSK